MNKWTFYNPKFEFLTDCADHVWYGHIFFAYDLIRNLEPETFVELGTYYGSSMSSFAQGVKDGNLSTKIYAIDSWEGDENAGFYGNYVYEHTQALVKKYYPELNINLVKKYFDKALMDFEDKSIDIIHIDGLHTYEAVKKDYQDWLPKMKTDGVMLFHDIFVEEHGVKDFWTELKSNPDYRTIEFPQSCGLGVLFLNNSVYSQLFDSVNIEELIAYYVKTAKESVTIEDVINAEIFRNIARAELEKTIIAFKKLKVELDEANSDRQALYNKMISLQNQCQELVADASRLKKIQSRNIYKALNKLMTIIGKPL
jgi:predicted O-methyltransferase YrrM